MTQKRNMRISQEISLPCGLQLPNRLCKSAMAEDMSHSHNPEANILTAYRQWADGGWGLMFTGNVQVSTLYLGSVGDVALPISPAAQSTLDLWKTWAKTCQASGTPAIVQLSHPGRQSPYGAGTHGFFTKNIAPSPVPMDIGPKLIGKVAFALIFGTPRAMTVPEIEEMIDMFVNGAKLAEESGFKGVELHAAHGYLLAQFMSPKSNWRDDEFGGTAAKRVEIVKRILTRMRKETGEGFCVGIKLNSADVSSAGDMKDTIEQIRIIVDCGVDFIEISGGTYENPLMMQDPQEGKENSEVSKSTTGRESFFLQFAQMIRSQFPFVVLLVTGGFRTRLGMEAALESGVCDLIGIARPAAILPKLAKEIIFNEEVEDGDASVRLKRVPPPWYAGLVGKGPVGAGHQTKYYEGQIQRIGRGEKPIDTRL